MATYVSAADGYWDAAATWTPQVVPVAGDVVTLLHSVRNGNAVNNACKDLTIESGGELYMYRDKIVAVSGDLILRRGGSLRTRTGDIMVGGNFRAFTGAEIYSTLGTTTLAVVGIFKLLGMTVFVDNGLLVVTLSQVGLAVGGSILGIDASGGERIVAYGSKDLGTNSNIDFYLARGKRAMMMLNRRAYQTGMVA